MSKIVLDFNSQIELKTRDKFGSVAAKSYKKQGLVMVSIYNKGQAVHGLLDGIIATKMGENASIKTKVINFTLEGKKYKVMVKNFVFHAVTEKPEYIEFISVDGLKSVDVLVPISISGKSVSPGVKRNGKVNIICYEVLVNAKIDKIPEEINVDISKFGLGKTFSSEEIKIDGVSVKSSFPILSIIGRGKKDAEEEAAEASAAAASATAAAKPAAKPAAK